MLRTNLSTRPFYNERAAHLVIAAAAAVVLGLTAWNVIRIVSLSRRNTELSSRVDQQKAETAKLEAQAAGIRKSINRTELEGVVAAAHEANTLIDQRTFSWTAFFNRIESTLPPDVMLTSVRPSFKAGETSVTMVVVGRHAEDIDEFMEKLEATGAFDEVVPGQGDRTEQGLLRQVIESRYQQVEDEPAAPAKAEGVAGESDKSAPAPPDAPPADKAPAADKVKPAAARGKS